MKKLFLIIIFLLCFGCVSKTSYVEGTAIQAGVYLPIDGTTYGFQLVNYISGIKLSCPSNSEIQISRKTSSSQNFFGVIKTSDTNHTDITILK